MVKLTADIINQSMQYINPCRERELDLRGYKTPQIENLGATLDQFDTIDFSDNDLRKRDGFPYLPRLKCLLLNNNRIIRMDDYLHESIPNLESVVLTGNNIQELGDLEPITHLKKLETLCLLVNPVSTKPYYNKFKALFMRFAFTSLVGSKLASKALTTGLKAIPDALNDGLGTLSENLNEGLQSLPDLMNEGVEGVLNNGLEAVMNKGLESVVNTGFKNVIETGLDFFSSSSNKLQESEPERKIKMTEDNQKAKKHDSREDVPVQEEKEAECKNPVASDHSIMSEIVNDNQEDIQQPTEKHYKCPKFLRKIITATK